MQTKKQRAGFRHFELGNKHFGRSQYSEARTHFERALKHDPENPSLLFYLGACHCNLNDNRTGLDLIRRSLVFSRGLADEGNRWWNASSFLFFAGEFEEARRTMLRAIDLLPDKITPMYNYCNMAKPKLDDPVVGRIHTLIEGGTLTSRGYSYAYYALSKAHEKEGDHRTAWDYALKGGRAYGVECNLDDENLDRIIRANTRKALTRQPCGGESSEAPVFIAGMPRSGTTFTETILSLHPQVLAAGELSGARTAELLAMSWASQNAPIANAFEHIRHIPPQLEEVAAGYLTSQVKSMAQGRPYGRFTDKLPENVFRLGLISRMFPRARVIVIHRHPLDNCVSCLFQRFNDIQYSYTNTIETLAVQYRAYQRVLAHWREVLPLRMLEVNYQQLVSDFEPQVRRIIDFLDLPWDPAVLDPGSSNRTVKTATAGQIRDGVNTRSVDRWKRYGDRVAPLVDALGGMDRIEEWAAQGWQAHRAPAAPASSAA